MKIRLMGSPDLIQKWKEELKAAYGIMGRTYANRNSHEVRYYVELDDRQAEAVISNRRKSDKKELAK